MNGLDTLATVADQVMLLPDQYLRQGVTILRSVIYLARLEEEGRREQALLVRQALEESEAPLTRSAALAAGQPESPPNQTWLRDFRSGDPDRQRIVASDAIALIAALEEVLDNLQFTNVTERQLVVEVRAAINRVRAMGNQEPYEEEPAGNL